MSVEFSSFIDTGALGGDNYIWRSSFLQRANRDFFLRSSIESSDTSVFLADDSADLKIDESFDPTIMTISTYGDRVASIYTTFGATEPTCASILCLADGLPSRRRRWPRWSAQRAIAFSGARSGAGEVVIFADFGRSRRTLLVRGGATPAFRPTTHDKPAQRTAVVSQTERTREREEAQEPL